LTVPEADLFVTKAQKCKWCRRPVVLSLFLPCHSHVFVLCFNSPDLK